MTTTGIFQIEDEMGGVNFQAFKMVQQLILEVIGSLDLAQLDDKATNRECSGAISGDSFRRTKTTLNIQPKET